MLTSYDIKGWKFPAGEVGVQLQWPTRPEDVYVHRMDDGTSDDVIGALMAADAAKRAGYEHLLLCMPYVPYGRQDRASQPGTAHSLSVFANLINESPYDSVFILDPHSLVSTKLLERVHVCHIEDAFAQINDTLLPRYEDGATKQRSYVVVAPDKGARLRARDITVCLRNKGYMVDKTIVAEKVRDPETGAIAEIKLEGIEPHQHVLVVDDICDGGATFIQLAPHLKGASKTLFVTHGFFSRGYSTVAAHYDRIITTDAVPSLKEDDMCPEENIVSIQPLIDTWIANYLHR